MTTTKRTRTSMVVFVLSVIILLYWILGWAINVYKVSIAGVIYELVWLPVIAMTFFLPVLILVLWFKEKFDFRSLYFYSLLLLTATVLFLTFFSK